MVEKVSNQARRLIFNAPFYGFFLSYIDKKIIGSNKVNNLGWSAGISLNKESLSYSLYVNMDFWNRLKKDDRNALKDHRVRLLMHECLHIIYDHPVMAASFNDKKLFNIAADLEINQICGDIGDGSEMTLEEYNEFMLKNKEKILSGEVQAPIRGCKLEDYGFDPVTESRKGTLYYYQKLQEKENQAQSSSGGGEDGDDDGDGSGQPQKGKSDRENIKDSKEVMGSGLDEWKNHKSWDEITDESESTHQLLKRYVTSMIDNASNSNPGNIPSDLRDLVEEKKKPPVTDWKSVFKRFAGVSSDFYTKTSRFKLNRRVEEFPGLRLKQKHRILTVIDTSGSMRNDDIAMCFSEIDHMYNAGVSIDVMEHDCGEVDEDHIYEYKGSIPKVKIRGGGGTSFDNPIKYAIENRTKYTSIIYLTDGYASIPQSYKRVMPIMWVITEDGISLEQFKEFPGLKLKMKTQN